MKRKVYKAIEDAGIEPGPMLAEMGATRSIIAGSTVLPTIVNTNFTPGDLDVYVLESGEIRIIDFLRYDMEFNADRTQSSAYSDVFPVLRVHWLVKGDHVVNVIVVPGDNAAISIFHFHSTVVMNFISANGVYCAYPDLTLNKRFYPNANLILADGSRQRTSRALAKYFERGFIFELDLPSHVGFENHTCGEDKNCPRTARFLHDDGGLFIPFGDEFSDDHPCNRYDGINSVMWSLGGVVCSNEGAYHATMIQAMKVLKR